MEGHMHEIKDSDLRLRSEALLKFEGYNNVQITTLFLNLMPMVTHAATVKLQKNERFAF